MRGYDKYYQTADLFGQPYPELIEFFKQYEPKGSLVDLGCGQGRNAIPLARLGYNITGIDSSKVGVEQMNSTARKEKLKITGLVEDIHTFNKYKEYNIVLLDSMFHFDKQGKQQEINLIKRITKEMPNHGLICICIQDTGKKVDILKDTINSSGVDFVPIKDTSLMYNYKDKKSGHKSETKYRIYILRKK